MATRPSGSLATWRRKAVRRIGAVRRSTLAFIADQNADNDFVLLTIVDTVTADQTPTVVQNVPASGDVQEQQPPRWTPAP